MLEGYKELNDEYKVSTFVQSYEKFSHVNLMEVRGHHAPQIHHLYPLPRHQNISHQNTVQCPPFSSNASPSYTQNLTPSPFLTSPPCPSKPKLA